MRNFILIFFFVLIAVRCLAAGGDTTVVGKIKNGERYGSWTYYDSEHHILKVEKYRKGKINRVFIFNAEGRVIERINKKGVITKLRACGC